MRCSGSISMGRAKYSICSARAVSIRHPAVNMALNVWRDMAGGLVAGWRLRDLYGAGRGGVSGMTLRPTKPPTRQSGSPGDMATGRLVGDQARKMIPRAIEC